MTKKGNVWLNIKGERKRVVLSEKELEYLSGSIVTHNHPDRTSFTIEDIVLMLRNSVEEMRIVSKYYSYTISNPSNKIIELKFLYDRYFELLEKTKLLYRTKLKTADFYREIQDKIIDTLAKEFGLIYKRTRR